MIKSASLKATAFSSQEELFVDGLSARQATLRFDTPRALVYLDPIVPKYSRIGESAQSPRHTTVDRDTQAAAVSPEPSVIIQREMEPDQERFLALASWEGIVLERTDKSFTARLIDKKSNGQDLEAEFALEEVSPRDRNLIKLGAIFYWDVGYSEDKSGQRMRASIIHFRRMPAWSRKEKLRIKQKAQKLRDAIGWK